MDNSSRLGRLQSQKRKLMANSILGLIICATVVCSLCLVITANSFAQSGPSGIVSDDFSSGVLDESVWTFVNPMGDGAYFITQTALLIDVPSSVSHDIWDVNNAPRLKQAANNTDFEIEAKFDSELTRKFQIQGLFVEQDEQNFIRFDLYSDDTGTYAYSATFSDEYGTGHIMLKTMISGRAPYYLRILRSGDSWSYYYSQDGTDWSQLVSFAHSMTVTAVGFFAGNHGTDADIPAHAGLVDYFFETSAPITPEDGGSTENTVATTIQGLGTVTKTPDLSTYPLGANVSLRAVADPKWTFVGWDGAVTGTQNPVTITVNNNVAVRAIFALSPEAIPQWVHLCSANGDLPTPAPSGGQIDVRIIDLDQNGENDLILTAWNSTEAIAWYRRQNGVYSKYIIASTSPTNLTHCINFRDIDGDGDVDLTFGEAGLGYRIYWWENPYPNYEPATNWTQRLVRDGPYKKYHDSIWGDFDGDGIDEYVAWNQEGGQLLLFEVPADPRTSGTWPATAIFTWTGGYFDEYSGLAAIDMNLDGKIDLVGGGGWFEHLGGTNFVYHVIDDEMRAGRVVTGQIIPGGRPEVVFASERSAEPLNFYEWIGTRWVPHCIKPLIDRTHTLQLGDVNLDGHLDIMTGEMGEWEPFDDVPDNPDATIRVLYGSGTGAFHEQIVNVGQGSLVGQLGDVDLDGDFDIVAKPFGHNIPRLDIWLNTGLDQIPGTPILEPRFDPNLYKPGQTITVTIDVTPVLSTLEYTLEDTPPDGWQVSDIDINEGGTWDSVNKKVKWGPFFDSNPRIFIYKVTPPFEGSGTQSFHGVFSANGIPFNIDREMESIPILEMNFLPGWSMISLPIIPNNATLSALFPGAVVVYSYEREAGYMRVQEDEELQVGVGYWILVFEDHNYVLTGQPIPSYSKTVHNDGWVMIGGCTLGARPKVDNADIGVIYKYVRESGYQQVLDSEVMEPGEGFWVLLNEVVDQCQLTVEAIGP